MSAIVILGAPHAIQPVFRSIFLRGISQAITRDIPRKVPGKSRQELREKLLDKTPKVIPQ